VTESAHSTDPGRYDRLIAVCDIFSENLPYLGGKYGTYDDPYTIEVEGPLTKRFIPELDDELQIQHRLREVPLILDNLVEISFISVADRQRLQFELCALDFMRDIFVEHEVNKLPDPRFAQLLLFKTAEETYEPPQSRLLLPGQISFDDLAHVLLPDAVYVHEDVYEAV
jgi:hypothetical protein